jgi:hypothetical protein
LTAHLRSNYLSTPNPTEIASFVPPDTLGPTNEIPGTANVTGVDVAANGAVVVSDANSGLYVLQLSQPSTAPTPTPISIPPVPVVAPKVSNYGVTNRTFVVSGTRDPRKHKVGTTFKFTLSKGATVHIVIFHKLSGHRQGKRCVLSTPRKHSKAARCTLVVRVGTLTAAGHSGAKKLAFSGRLRSNALSPSRYSATITATGAGNKTSLPHTLSFTELSRLARSHPYSRGAWA